MFPLLCNQSKHVWAGVWGNPNFLIFPAVLLWESIIGICHHPSKKGLPHVGEGAPADRTRHLHCLFAEESTRWSPHCLQVVTLRLGVQASLEKASIDEVFVDVTTLVEKELLVSLSALIL